MCISVLSSYLNLYFICSGSGMLYWNFSLCPLQKKNFYLIQYFSENVNFFARFYWKLLELSSSIPISLKNLERPWFYSKRVSWKPVAAIWTGSWKPLENVHITVTCQPPVASKPVHMVTDTFGKPLSELLVSFSNNTIVISPQYATSKPLHRITVVLKHVLKYCSNCDINIYKNHLWSYRQYHTDLMFKTLNQNPVCGWDYPFKSWYDNAIRNE
jgi:hypothetical protein